MALHIKGRLFQLHISEGMNLIIISFSKEYFSLISIKKLIFFTNLHILYHMMYFMNRIIILVFLSCFFLAGNTWADSNKSADYADEKPVIKIYPYTFGQLPPTYYGETNLPVGEVLIINISRFPVSSQGESAVISVLSADEKTKTLLYPPETKRDEQMDVYRKYR